MIFICVYIYDHINLKAHQNLKWIMIINRVRYKVEEKELKMDGVYWDRQDKRKLMFDLTNVWTVYYIKTNLVYAQDDDLLVETISIFNHSATTTVIDKLKITLLDGYISYKGCRLAQIWHNFSESNTFP